VKNLKINHSINFISRNVEKTHGSTKKTTRVREVTARSTSQPTLKKNK